MIHINQYIKESLLDDEDDIFNNAGDAIEHRILPEIFKKWVWTEDSGWTTSARRAVKHPTSSSKIRIVNGRLDTYKLLCGPFSVSEGTIPIPEEISLEYVPSFIVCGDGDVVKQCWDQLPRKTASFSMHKTQRVMDGFRIQCFDCLIDSRCKVKDLTLDVPGRRAGGVNNFELHFYHLQSEEDLKNIRVNGVHNICVRIDASEYATKVVAQLKKDVSKLRKKNPNVPVNDLFLESIKKYLPLDWIDENWKGINTIVIKRHSSSDHSVFWLHDTPQVIRESIKHGECVLTRENGSWVVIQKLTRDS
jgi:hypothetical protein